MPRCMPVRRGAREVYVGFWDMERGSGLFISTEEELQKKQFFSFCAAACGMSGRLNKMHIQLLI